MHIMLIYINNYLTINNICIILKDISTDNGLHDIDIIISIFGYG